MRERTNAGPALSPPDDRFGGLKGDTKKGFNLFPSSSPRSSSPWIVTQFITDHLHDTNPSLSRINIHQVITGSREDREHESSFSYA